MKAWTKIALVTGSLAMAASAGCSSDDTSGDGDGDSTGDTETTGDGDGDMATTGDGDGDTTTTATSGDGDGDSSTSGGGDGGGSGEGCSTILELAAATDDLSSLVAAVEAAGIGDALTGDNLTVFAPTNDAFADLLAALGLDFADLTAENLTPILTYHVADSVVDSTAAVGVAEGDGAFMTLGGTIQLSIGDDDSLMIDADESGASVVMADIEACNGVVHVVDQVLVPSITDIVVTHPDLTGLYGLIGASDMETVDVGMALNGPSSEGAWTLFAPDNDAVDAAPSGLTAEQITTALLYHAYASEDAVPASVAVTLDADIATAGGEELSVLGDATAGSVTLTDGAGNDVNVIVTDIYASNGIIHVIDGVLIPPSLVE